MPTSWTRRRFLGLAAALGANAAGTACAAASATDGGSVATGPHVTSATPARLSIAAAAATPRAAPLFGPLSSVPIPADAADVALSSPSGSRAGPGPDGYRTEAYRGLGCWIDVFDWSVSYAGAVPPVGPNDMGSLADQNVRTVFLQTARYDRPHPSDDLLERGRLLAITDAAHARGMRVVGWYLPTHLDPVLDLRRGLAVLGEAAFDGFALDIESRLESDVALRNHRLAVLSADLRRAAGPSAALGAITVPPTTMEDVNPNYWPGFDWPMLASTFDVFLPMNYWTGRLAGSPWRDAAASTAENIRRLRAHAGRADYPVHVVGGIADAVTPAEVAAMVRAAERRASPASLYDLATTGADLWPALR